MGRDGHENAPKLYAVAKQEYPQPFYNWLLVPNKVLYPSIINILLRSTSAI